MNESYLERRLCEMREGLGQDPAALRAAIAMLMCELTDSQIGLWYRFGLVDGEPYPVEWSLVGAPEFLVESQSRLRIPWPAGDPRLPERSWLGSFVPMTSILSLQALEQTQLYEQCYARIGIHDQVRMMVYHQGRHVAWIGALRARGERPLSPRDVRGLRAVARPVADALVHADAVARANTPEESADFVIDATGRVEFASDGAAALLAHPERAAILAHWVRAADSGLEPPRVLLGQTVRWSRLHGPAGSRYLLHLDQIEPLRLMPTFELSRTQRRVALHAATGASVAEMAESLGVASTTIRTHLRAIYESLGVASRAELANLLREGNEQGTHWPGEHQCGGNGDAR